MFLAEDGWQGVEDAGVALVAEGKCAGEEEWGKTGLAKVFQADINIGRKKGGCLNSLAHSRGGGGKTEFREIFVIVFK